MQSCGIIHDDVMIERIFCGHSFHFSCMPARKIIPKEPEKQPLALSQSRAVEKVSSAKHSPRSADAPMIGIIMGSDSDLSTMRKAADICEEFGVSFEMRVVSAHRTPDDMAEYGRTAHQRGIQVIIAGAGGAAHLPGMIAAHSPLPVIGVPIESKSLDGMDSLLSIVQMPAGVPVATVAIGGGKNAGLLAIQILATSNRALLARMIAYKAMMAEESRKKNDRLLERSSTR